MKLEKKELSDKIKEYEIFPYLCKSVPNIRKRKKGIEHLFKL
jgi:hypothetical protein